MKKNIVVKIGKNNVANDLPLTLIAGPCLIESKEHAVDMAGKINEICSLLNINFIFKSSFDKANRTSIKSARGIGLNKSLSIFSEIKKKIKCSITTDVHEPDQCSKVSKVVDLLQIPAFLCRQTDLIVECAKHFSAVNIKKGQWLGPHNLINSVDKIKETNEQCEAWISDRGSNFGYHELFVNFSIVDELKQYYDRVILDCTHSIQRSRAVYGSQGDRTLAERYFLAADIFGYDGVFAEVHPNPSMSVSDGDCALNLESLNVLLHRAKQVGKV
mgnify:CR=1 FL=1